jgi:hypothetical protein
VGGFLWNSRGTKEGARVLVRYRVLLPIALNLSFLIFLESDRAVFVVFLALVGTCSTLAGRELARAVPPKAGVIGSVLIWGGIAALHATGVVTREPGYSEYLVYLAVLMTGYVIPLSVLIETFRNRRNRSE